MKLPVAFGQRWNDMRVFFFNTISPDSWHVRYQFQLCNHHEPPSTTITCISESSSNQQLLSRIDVALKMGYARNVTTLGTVLFSPLKHWTVEGFEKFLSSHLCNKFVRPSDGHNLEVNNLQIPEKTGWTNSKIHMFPPAIPGISSRHIQVERFTAELIFNKLHSVTQVEMSSSRVRAWTSTVSEKSSLWGKWLFGELYFSDKPS